MKLNAQYSPLVVAVMCVLLAGCAGGAGDTNLVTGAIPEGQARVSVTRPSSIVYAGAPATITVNGKKAADVWAGATSSFNVPSGSVVIAASAWSYPGEFKINLNAVPGKTYKLVVEPRSNSLLPGAALGPIGGVIDASVNENAGAFQLRVIKSGD
ncbi:MAG: hypothetical protein RIC14_12580 [Filomicrobium sp.]